MTGLKVNKKLSPRRIGDPPILISSSKKAIDFLKEVDMHVNSKGFKDLDQSHWKGVIEDYFVI